MAAAEFRLARENPYGNCLALMYAPVGPVSCFGSA